MREMRNQWESGVVFPQLSSPFRKDDPFKTHDSSNIKIVFHPNWKLTLDWCPSSYWITYI